MNDAAQMRADCRADMQLAAIVAKGGDLAKAVAQHRAFTDGDIGQRRHFGRCYQIRCQLLRDMASHGRPSHPETVLWWSLKRAEFTDQFTDFLFSPVN